VENSISGSPGHMRKNANLKWTFANLLPC